MPTRDAALKAIDDAFADGLKHLFDVLVQGLNGGQRQQAVERFASGIGNHVNAHATASEVIKQALPEASNG